MPLVTKVKKEWKFEFRSAKFLPTLKPKPHLDDALAFSGI